MPDNNDFSGADLDASSVPLQTTPAAFAAFYAPVAQKISDQTGIDPNTILGQFGLETGWGKSIVPGTNNLGNIKDFSKSGSGVTATDNQNGSVDKYKKYDSVDDFANDYANLINTRYQGALNTGTDAAATGKALTMGGYAQDPAYTSKLIAATSMVGKARGLTPQEPASGNSMSPISSANAAPGPSSFDGSDLDAALNNPHLNPDQSVLGTIGSSIADAADGIATGAGQIGLGGVALAGRGIKAAGDALGSDGLSSAGSYLNDHATTAVKNLGQQQSDFTGDSTSGKVGNFIGQAAGSVPLALATGPLGEAAGAASVVGRAAPVVAGAVDLGAQGAILGASNAAGAGQSDLLTPAVIGGGAGALLGGAVGGVTSKLQQYLSGAGKDFNAAVDATVAPTDATAGAVDLGASIPGGATSPTAGAASSDAGSLGSRLAGVAQDTVNGAKNNIVTAGYSPDELALTAAQEQLGPDFQNLLQQSQYAANPVGPAVPDALVPAANRIPLTAAQQADSPRMALLAKNIGNYSPEAKAAQAQFAMEQQQGVHQAIDQLTPAQDAINALKKDRNDAVNQLYAANDSTLVPVQDFGQELLDRPVIKKALANANIVLRNGGEEVPTITNLSPEDAVAQVKAAGGNAAAQLKAAQEAQAAISSTGPTHISGRQFQAAEQDLRAQAQNMTTATPSERASAKAALSDFRAAGEQSFPLWKEAQDKYAAMSRPITDAEFNQTFSQHPSTTMMNGDSRNINSANFNSAYKGSLATGSAKQYGITPEAQMQMDALQSRINKIAQTNLKAGSVGSDTAPNLAGMASLESILGKNTSGGGLTTSDLLTHSGTVMGTIAGIAKKGLERAQQPVRDAASRAVQDVVQNPAGLAQLVERVAASNGKLSKEANTILNATAQTSPETVATVVQNASIQGKATLLNELSASSKKKVLPFLMTVAKQASLTGLLQSIQSDSKKK